MDKVPKKPLLFLWECVVSPKGWAARAAPAMVTLARLRQSLSALAVALAAYDPVSLQDLQPCKQQQQASCLWPPSAWPPFPACGWPQFLSWWEHGRKRDWGAHQGGHDRKLLKPGENGKIILGNHSTFGAEAGY